MLRNSKRSKRKSSVRNKREKRRRDRSRSRRMRRGEQKRRLKELDWTMRGNWLLRRLLKNSKKRKGLGKSLRGLSFWKMRLGLMRRTGGTGHMNKQTCS